MTISTQAQPQLSRTFINFVFAVALFAVIALSVAPKVTNESNDFFLYHNAAKHFCEGRGADAYAMNLSLGKAGAGLNETPLFLWAVAPVGLLPFGPAKFVFDSTMIILLAVSTLILARTAELTNSQTIRLIGLVALSGPVFEVIRVSKPSPILLTGMALSLFYLKKGQEIKAGAVAVLCLLKPQEILPFVIYALGCGRYRFIAALAVTGLLVAVLTFPFYGVEGYTNYLNRILYIDAHPEFAGTTDMPILAGQFIRMSLLSPAMAIKVGKIIYGLALIALFVLGLRQRTSNQWWQTGAVCAVLAMACLFPYIYAYDLVIVIPGLYFLLKTLFEQKRKLLIAASLISVTAFMLPFYIFIHYFPLGVYLIRIYPICMIDFHFCALAMLSVASLLTLRFKNGVTEGSQITS